MLLSSERADDLADWVMERSRGADEDRQRQLGRVLAAATNDHLTELQGDAFASRVPNLDTDELRALCMVLSYLDTWPLRSPRLTTNSPIARDNSDVGRSSVTESCGRCIRAVGAAGMVSRRSSTVH